jgi:6-phosphogluconolactonase
MRFIALLSALLFSLCSFAQNYYLFVGTYTTGKSEGIYVYRFNASTGDAEKVSTASTKNPSYLAIGNGGKYLYAVNEVGNGGQGDVSAFAFDKASGKLQFINKQQSGGADPCYISAYKNGKWLVVANYSGGNLAALPIKADGSIDPVAQVIRHEGSSINKDRQEKAHVHMTEFSPDQHFLFTPDLGMDKVMIYSFNPASAQPLAAAMDSFISVEPGSGPRHLAFHPKKPYAYLIEELSGTVEAFHYNNGKLKQFQRISSHPADYKGTKGSADIHISPDGKFLYASNRGDANSIAIYGIDSANGKLHLKGIQSTMGKAPRNFVIEPTGHYLLAANQDSDNVVIFKINTETGLLTATGKQLSIPNPVCLKLLKN